MTAQGAAQDSQENLIAALESGRLSPALETQGREILSRMQQVLRLSVMGSSGSGKSSVMNLLLGSDVLPQHINLPTISIVYGEVECVRCTLRDGKVRQLDTADMYSVAALDPVFVEIEMPLPSLRKLSMMEVVTSGDLVEQQRAVAWATKRTDIAIWCTQRVSPEEEQLWDMLPDPLLDHAFLLLTKADELDQQGILSDCLGHAEDRGSELFYKVMTLETIAALSARGPGGAVDKEALRESGGMALISAILRQVEQGERAAIDAADIFLRQVGYDPAAQSAETPDTFGENVSKPQVENHPEVEEFAESMAVAPTKDPGEAVEEDDVASIDVNLDAAAGAPDSTPLTDTARAAFSQVVEQIVSEGQALTADLTAEKTSENEMVTVAVETLTWAEDYLTDANLADEPAAQQALAMVKDAADLVQLIQLETGDSVALDALSVMIQLKHEIQAELEG